MKHLAFLVSLYAACSSAIGYAFVLALPKLDSTLYLGACTLDDEAILDDAAILRFCTQPNLDMDILTNFRAEHSLHQVGRLYIGSHYRHYSLHFQGFLHQSSSLNRSTTSLTRYTEMAAIRIGNYAYDHWNLTLGEQPLPFGLHFNPIQGAYYQFNNERYWRSPTYGVNIGWDNWQKIRIEAGWASDFKKSNDPTQKKIKTGVGARFIYDFSALNGTRFILSLSGENIGTRKVGAALLHNAKDTLFQIEWIREKDLQQPSDADYLQFLRFSITGPYQRNTRTVLLYEDAYNSHRIGILQQDWKLPFPLHYHIALGYRKEESGVGPNQWILFTGMTLHL